MHNAKDQNVKILTVRCYSYFIIARTSQVVDVGAGRKQTGAEYGLTSMSHLALSYSFMPFPGKYAIRNSNGQQVQVPSFLLSINSPITLSLTGWLPIIFPSLGVFYVYSIISPNNYPFSLSTILLDHPSSISSPLYFLSSTLSYWAAIPSNHLYPRFTLLLRYPGRISYLISSTTVRLVLIVLLRLRITLYLFLGDIFGYKQSGEDWDWFEMRPD